MLDKILKRAPSYTDAQILLGNILFLEKDYPRALNIMTQVTRRNGKYQHGFVLIGCCLGFLDQPKQALEADNRAIAIGGPETGSAYRAKSQHLLALGRAREARDTILLAIKFDKQNPELNKFNLEALAGIEEQLDAEKLATSGQKENPELSKARALWQAGDENGCVKILDALIRKNPDSLSAYSMKADMYWEAMEYDKAMAAMQSVVAKKPDYQHGHLVIGRCLFQTHRFPESLAALDRALKCTGLETRRIHREKSFVLVTIKRYKEALAEIDAALKLDHGSLQLQEDTTTKCKIFEAMQDWKSLRAEADNLVKLVLSNSAPPFRFRAEANEHLGNYDAAIADYKSGLKLSPGNIDCLRGLASTYQKQGDKKNAEAIRKSYEL